MNPTTAKEIFRDRIAALILKEVKRRRKRRMCVLGDVVEICNRLLPSGDYEWRLADKKHDW